VEPKADVPLAPGRLALHEPPEAGGCRRRIPDPAIDLVKVESGRDAKAEDEARWRQARGVAVDLRAAPVLNPSTHEIAIELGIWNTSADPMLKCRIKVQAGSSTWGPQLVSTIGPGERAVLTVVVDAPPPMQTSKVGSTSRTWRVGRGSRVPPIQWSQRKERWINGSRMVSGSLNGCRASPIFPTNVAGITPVKY